MELNYYKHGSQFGEKNTLQSKEKSWLAIKIQRHTPTSQQKFNEEDILITVIFLVRRFKFIINEKIIYIRVMKLN
jgi:hypothetical protein